MLWPQHTSRVYSLLCIAELKTDGVDLCVCACPVQNLYFAYLFVLRAVTKAAPLLRQYHYDTEMPEEDARTQRLIKDLVRPHAHTHTHTHTLAHTHGCTCQATSGEQGCPLRTHARAYTHTHTHTHARPWTLAQGCKRLVVQLS